MFANPFFPYALSTEPAATEPAGALPQAMSAFPSGGAAPAIELWVQTTNEGARLYMEALAALSRCRTPVDAAEVVAKYMQQSSQLTLNAVGRASEMMRENASALEVSSPFTIDSEIARQKRSIA